MNFKNKAIFYVIQIPDFILKLLLNVEIFFQI